MMFKINFAKIYQDATRTCDGDQDNCYDNILGCHELLRWWSRQLLRKYTRMPRDLVTDPGEKRDWLEKCRLNKLKVINMRMIQMMVMKQYQLEKYTQGVEFVDNCHDDGDDDEYEL